MNKGRTQEEVKTDYYFSIVVQPENALRVSYGFPVCNISASTKRLLVELLEGNPDVKEVSTQYL